ncbi:MAG: NAD(P)/FAD-dependent oxidoreductase, partial [Eubacteriales bacterium]|nr:NAD(P)/FAD-dependent oxidoreductase [Eubacteriales bacterium]
MKIYDLVIVGGGVSGMTVAASVDLKNVLLLEKEDRIGKKLLATGNGRCNLLNQNFSVEAYNDKNFVA